MSDHTIKHGDDEYHFPGDEYMDAESSVHADAKPEQAQEEPAHDPETMHQQASPSAQEVEAEMAKESVAAKVKSHYSAIKNKRIVWVIVAAVVVLVTFTVMRHQDKPNVVQQAQPAVQQPVAQQVNPQMASQLNQLQRSEQSSEQAIGQLQSNLHQLQTGLQTEANSQAQTNRNINALISQVQLLTKQVHELKAAKKPVHKAVHKAKPIVYHLKAIEPGRAWIMGSNGESDTIAIGNQLKGYGTVEALDTDRGVVLTSSGKVIAYGQDDN